MFVWPVLLKLDTILQKSCFTLRNSGMYRLLDVFCQIRTTICQNQGWIKVFAGPGQLAFWGPLDKQKSKKSTLNGSAGEIFGENGPVAKFS
jgi:hypothetical protein